ncbi:SCO7613 C-terminal domain-containing membrane protein [Actinomadura kijaniata]|uniref:SCO7613 C-terminal domain-containing membrane protein n=1 Tax=Actinomadura kijaniata TaxID=46161 RepID=UPI003F1A9903
MRPSCPSCGTALPLPAQPSCPRCDLTLTGPSAAELWRVDEQIRHLARYRVQLLAALHSAPAAPHALPVAVASPAPREVSRPGARNVLLALGGALLGVAALAFTVISWGSLGMGARALILLTLTAVALGAARPLTRRGLTATAETLAVVGLLLVVLQCYAARAGNVLGLGAVDGPWYAAGAATAVTAGWACYARYAPLRLPAPLAVLAGQTPPLFTLVALDVPEAGAAATLLLLSLANLAVRETLSGPGRGAATLLGLLAGLLGTLAALAVEPRVALLACAAATALGWALRLDAKIAAVTGLTCAAALAFAFPGGWSAASPAVAAVLVAAAALALANAVGRLSPVAVPVAAGTLPVLAVAAVRASLDVFAVLAGPFVHGVPAGFLVATPVVLALLAAGAWAPCRPATPPLVALAALTAAPSWATGLALAVSLGLWAALDRSPHVPVAAAATVPPLALWTFAAAPGAGAGTLVLAAHLLLGAAVAAAVPRLRNPAVAFAILHLGGLTATLDPLWPTPHRTAFALLACAAAGTAVALRSRSTLGEAVAWLFVPVALAMTRDRPGLLALAFALTGLLGLGVATRPGRRRAGWAGVAALGAAWWTFLSTLGVTAVEAYAAPVSAVLLVLGLRRSGSSWERHGPALAAMLAPSLVAAWPGHGPRPLLLALAALAVTLAGVRLRLQAPLLMGGATVLLVAGDAVAPLVTEFLTRLPGWVPVAALGLFTLVVGATYEQRLRDLRRMRTTFAALR